MNATTVNTAPATHTAGPWNTGALMSRVEVLPEGWNMPMCIADCGTKHAPESEGERVANARLIAAAPDLLAVLAEIVGQETPNKWGYDAAGVAMNDAWRERARAALARATT